MVSNKRLLNEIDTSHNTSQIKRIANPAGSFNPTGGILSSRRFGAGASLKNGNQGKVYQFGHGNKLLLETEGNDSDTYIDDNMSTGDVFVVGGTSEYNTDQSFLSIKQFESSDGGESQWINGNNSDGASSYLDIRQGGGNSS